MNVIYVIELRRKNFGDRVPFRARLARSGKGGMLSWLGYGNSRHGDHADIVFLAKRLSGIGNG